MHLVAYPLPSGEWNVNDAHKKPGSGTYTVRLGSNGSPLSIVNGQGRSLRLDGDTARRVLSAVSVKKAEMRRSSGRGT